MHIRVSRRCCRPTTNSAGGRRPRYQNGVWGFAYGINFASGFIGTGQSEEILVIAADALTRSVDYTDRYGLVLFGDGAGAALVEYGEGPRFSAWMPGPTETAESFFIVPRCAPDQRYRGHIATCCAKTDGASTVGRSRTFCPSPIASRARRHLRWTNRLVRTAQREPPHDRSARQTAGIPARKHALLSV